MTSHFFHHPLVDLHYYRFGHGPKVMLCFHGYGMHGRQFRVLEEKLGEEYTFYGFDLFFHEKTRLQIPALKHIKQPISKAEFKAIMEMFCEIERIDRFSIISYSMGTHYAVVLAELMAERIDHLFMLAPSYLRVFLVFKLLAENRLANLVFYKLLMSEKVMMKALLYSKKLGILVDKDYRILKAEMAIPEMRFALYGNVTCARHLKSKTNEFAAIMNTNQVQCHFIFGARDKIYHAKLADQVIAKLHKATKTVLDEDHDLVNPKLSNTIYQLLHEQSSMQKS